MLPEIPEEHPGDLETHAQRSLGQRFRLLFSRATLGKWWHYTRIGTIWLWAIASGGALVNGEPAPFLDGGGLLATVGNWVLSLLASGLVCLIVAAAGMWPLVVHAALDRRRGHIGLGFLLGLVLSCTMLAGGVLGLFWVRDLIQA